MTDYSVDAIKIAKAIQKDELSILRGKEFKMRDRIKKKRRMKKTGKTKNRVTLAQISSDLAKLNQKVDGISARLDYIVQANNLKDNK